MSPGTSPSLLIQSASSPCNDFPPANSHQQEDSPISPLAHVPSPSPHEGQMSQPELLLEPQIQGAPANPEHMHHSMQESEPEQYDAPQTQSSLSRSILNSSQRELR